MEEVNSPSHYNKGSVEVIEVMQDQMRPMEYKGFLKGNILKYVLRYQDKGGVKDLHKAEWLSLIHI
jgi:hypothetical protein